MVRQCYEYMHSMWCTTATIIQNKKARRENNIYICSQTCYFFKMTWSIESYKEDTSKKQIKYNEASESLKDWKIKEKYTVCLTSN